MTVGTDYVVYRDCGAGLTKKGQASKAAKEFVAFLASNEGAAIFKKWGFRWGGDWKDTPDPMHFELASLLNL